MVPRKIVYVGGQPKGGPNRGLLQQNAWKKLKSHRWHGGIRIHGTRGAGLLHVTLHRRQGGGRGGRGTHSMLGRSRMTIDPRVPIMPERSASRFQG